MAKVKKKKIKWFKIKKNYAKHFVCRNSLKYNFKDKIKKTFKIKSFIQYLKFDNKKNHYKCLWSLR